MDSISYNKVYCIVCKKETTIAGIHSHFLFKHYKHLTNYNNAHSAKSIAKSVLKNNAIRLQKRLNSIEEYEKSPARCNNCGCNLKYDSRGGKFCSRRCAGIFNNKVRADNGTARLSEETKNKIRNKLLARSGNKKLPISGPYTKIYLCKCKYSGIMWYSRTAKTVHPDLQRNKKEYGYSCRFSFGISSYPLWFANASELLNEYGWYSTPGSNKRGISNVNGVSRDHLFSVRDGFKMGVHPSVLRHPANCELKTHMENQRKGRTSSITLNELLIRIQEFNKLYPDYPERVEMHIAPFV